MRPKVHDTFQPKSETHWGYDTIARCVQYGTERGATLGGHRLQRDGWSVSSAYPTNDHRVIAVKRVYNYSVKFEILSVCDDCDKYISRCKFNHGREVLPKDPTDVCFTGKRRELSFETRVNAFDINEAIRKAMPRFFASGIARDRSHFTVKVFES